MAKRNQKPEVRKAQREQAVRAAKDQKKATVKKPAVKVHIISSSNNIYSLVQTRHFINLILSGQGRAEGPEGNKERSQGRTRQGWRQAINILL